MNQTIIELINKYEDKGGVNYATVTDDMIAEAEKSLGLKIPEQFIEYIKRYGYGGIGGIGVLGVGLDGSIVFRDVTLEYREEGLPLNYIVIENVDEWLECIDCNTGKIVSWDMGGGVQEDFDCFDDYIISQMHDVIENM